ncbi:MAG: SDR family oxidoreductase [Betaproteobacteria bacterium]|nr:SDR family oxidoreductase [Betaproteobacteria bacterium]MDH5222991.1 SDR family oxidoreductase [Betaproteobacteria bacterium]
MAAQSKVAIVTGASAGIGEAAGVALVKAGWKVAFAARRAELLEKIVAQCGAANALAVATDVAKPESVKSLFAKTLDKFGRLDLLFNNAGMGAPPVPMDELPYEKWKEVVDVNLNGMFLCAQEAFRIFKRQHPQGGRIINNGSISAHAPRPFSAAYTSTKHAVTGLTKCIALDGRAHDICGCQIDIGNAATPMTERMTKGVPQPNGSTMIEPRMDVQHVADAIVYMAGLPKESNVLTMTVMATKMPFVGRG